MTLHYVSNRELAKPKTYFLGVDLGQANDFTAFVSSSVKRETPVSEYPTS